MFYLVRVRLYLFFFAHMVCCTCGVGYDIHQQVHHRTSSLFSYRDGRKFDNLLRFHFED